MKTGWRSPFRQKIGCVVTSFIFCAIGFLCNEFQVAAEPRTGLPHAERARALMQSQNYAAAIEEWKAALKVEPDNPIYNNLYGLALQSVGRPADARRQFQRAIQLNPDFPDALSNLAYNLWTDGKDNAAILEFDRALKLRPADPGLHLARGLLATSNNKHREGCKHLDQARPWPDDPETLWRIFSAYQDCNQSDKSEEAARLLPSDSETQLSIGQAFLAFHQPQLAIPFLERAAMKSSESALLLAEAHLGIGDPEKALQELSILPEPESNSAAAVELRASCLIKMGKKTEAQEQFAELVRRFPENPAVYIDATQIPLEDQNWEESLKILDAGLERIPESWPLLFRRGMTFKLSGQSNEAEGDLLNAMRHGGDISLLAAALGEVYASQGNLAGAAQIFRKTFNETGVPEFQVAYAVALEKQGNVTEALKEMEKAAVLLPNDARTHFEYGKLLSENGRMNDARRELERAKALDPKLSENLYVLSRL
jgi:tetratricopeptide (TPR) repeat protein